MGDDFAGWGSIIDVAIFLGLAYGVYRRSRAAAIVLFAYHLLNRVLMYRLTGELNTLLGVGTAYVRLRLRLGDSRDSLASQCQHRSSGTCEDHQLTGRPGVRDIL